MSTRSRRPWPVSRTTAILIGSAVGAGALAAKVPELRGGLFLLAGFVVMAGFALRDTGYRIRRQSRRPSN